MPRRFAKKAATLAAALVALLASGAGEAAASHVACGQTITEDTKLDSDVVGCRPFAVHIASDDVTLDLNHHTVEGGIATHGIEFGGSIRFDHVTIENGTVSARPGFAPAGIALAGDFNRVRHVEIRGASLVMGADELHDSSEGAVIDHVSVFDSPDFAIQLFGAHDFAVVHSKAVDSFGVLVGWFLQRGDIAFNAGSTSSAPFGTGIGLIFSTGNTVRSNVLELADDEVGIDLSGNDNEVERNRISGGSYGVSLHGFLPRVPERVLTSVGNAFIRNVVTRAAVDGIFVQGPEPFCGFVSCDPVPVYPDTAATVLTRNEAIANGDDGIDADSADATVARNRARGNGDLGIEAVPGVVDGRRNRASGNGNPLQCLYVECR
jgi:hypothetical protein